MLINYNDDRFALSINHRDRGHPFGEEVSRSGLTILQPAQFLHTIELTQVQAVGLGLGLHTASMGVSISIQDIQTLYSYSAKLFCKHSKKSSGYKAAIYRTIFCEGG